MNYTWEAEKQDGTIFTVGGDLADCKRISFIPNNPILPQHDLIGVKLKKRFDRICQAVIGKQSKKILHCVEAEGFRLYLNDETGAVLTVPEDYELYL